MSQTLERSESGHIESAVGDAAREFASRFSRRSFLGRLGATAVAASVGTSAAVLYEAPAAAAAFSEACGNVFPGLGYCDTSKGCYCGCWNSGTCSFCDCCDKSGYCTSGNHCHTYPDGAPICCYKKEWSSPAGCGVVGQTTIICRDGFC